MTEITLNKDEHIEYLRKDFGLIVSKEHTFGTDALCLPTLRRRNDMTYAATSVRAAA